MSKLKNSFFLLFLLFSANLFALYTGNPAGPSLLRHGMVTPINSLVTITTGYVYTKVWDMDLTPKDLPPDVTLEKIGDTEMLSNFASVGLILLRRLEVYSYLGVSKESIDWKSRLPFTSNELETKNHFSFSVGAKAIMLQFGGTVFSLDFQYFTLPSTDKLLPKIVNLYMPIPLGKQYLNMDQWQVAAGLASKIGPFCPYIGGKYSKVRLKVNSTEGIPNLAFRNRNNWGLFAGASINFGTLLSATGEIRWFDEKGASAAVSMVF